MPGLGHDWEGVETVKPKEAMLGWYVLGQQGVKTMGQLSSRQLLNCGFRQEALESSATYATPIIAQMEEAQGAQLETWDVESREDFACLRYLRQTKAD